MSDALRQALVVAGVDALPLDALTRYGQSVLETNRSFNLTGAKTAEEVAAHIADSLTLLPYVENDLVDIGSGAGFPAIPIAIAAGIPVTLVESNRKKAAFLERTLRDFELDGAVVAERAESAAHGELRERFTTGTARAVATASTVAELLLPFIRVGSVAVLQRGMMDDRERVALADASVMLGAVIEAEHHLTGERRIVLLRKTASTPQRFPRRTGIPEKRPLCG